jgi:predicted CXXCH cytochrome family protein
MTHHWVSLSGVALEWLLAAIVMALAARLLGVRERYWPWLLASMTIAGGAAALASSSARTQKAPAPIARTGQGYVTSNACRSCHPAEYSSWHASFHRRMTQSATLEHAAAPVLRQGGRLQTETNGRSVELLGRDGQLWARLPDPGLTSAALAGHYESVFRAAPTRDVRVELLTGSHHQQAFWVKGARPGELRAVPAVYLIAEGKLVPRRDAFLNPPDAGEHAVRWNSNCIQCHAVAGAPRHDEATDSFTSGAAELGVACEACHGPGAEHVRAMQDPFARYRARDSRSVAPFIVNPQLLNGVRSSEVCGRCHSYFFPKQESDWWQHGFSNSYRPGQPLADSQLLLSREALAAPGAPQLGESAESIFYDDGTVRVGGREYNGLVRSPCYERGRGERQLGCLSCHSLHQSEPDDQLARGMRDNQACTQCHTEQGSDVSRHSHHGPSSSGSLCYNCHMAKTSYALLGAIRSHRIDVPAFDRRTRDRPNACSLCHLEQSERWAADKSTEWYGRRPSFELAREPGLDDPGTPAGAVFALAGDAAVRAITAAALGRLEGGNIDRSLRRQLLAELAMDDYAAVRFIAERSLANLPSQGTAPSLAVEQILRLKGQRDTRSVTIAE